MYTRNKTQPAPPHPFPQVNADMVTLPAAADNAVDSTATRLRPKDSTLPRLKPWVPRKKV
ncbi:hypothetical protein GCM10022420_011460 [Streptomyces iranensis]